MRPPNAPEASRALNDATAGRFARDLGALCDIGRDRVLVAVSGGPDSLALLLLTHDAIGDRCRAATVDHGLRPESAGEAAGVAELCAARGIDHAILSAPLPERADGGTNVSARARLLRYELLGAHAAATGADRIATAHHANDQVETMILRLNRGAGGAGLVGIRASNGRVIRPLLDWRRAELFDLVAAAGLDAVDDPSNVDDRYDRARLRKQLAAIDWIDAAGWGASARALGDVEEALAWSVDRAASTHLRRSPGEAVLTPGDLPREIRRRLVERAVRHLDPAAAPRGPALAATLDTLESGERTMLGAALCTVDRDGNWRFTPAPPRRSA